MMRQTNQSTMPTWTMPTCLPIWKPTCLNGINRCWSVIVVLFVFAIVSTDSLNAAAPSRNKTQIPQVAEIDRLIKQTWSDYGLKPSREASDGEWCRRVYLDLIGRTPTVQELSSFMSRRGNRREKLVETLLTDDKYTEEFARNWTTIWTNILIGRTGGTVNNTMISREGMQKYLRDSFARNKPYDKMVAELVSATGTTTPGTEDFNGATNFLIEKVNEEKATLATAATSKVFLGLQVQCTQCHNHPFNDWKQSQFWEMNAFFRQTSAKRNRGRGNAMTDNARLVDEDFNGEDGNKATGLSFYELRNGEVKAATPVFVDGQAIGASGSVSSVKRREKLAQLIVESTYLEKTAVNRLWGHFLGYGFTKPVDDMGPHNPPSHPALLEYMAVEFRKSGFDTKQLIKWITLSSPYNLSSRTTNNNRSDDPLLGESPKFTHFYLRQMRAEELYESLVTATKASEGMSFEQQERQKDRWLRQFNIAFGTDEGDETTSFNGTIPQVLMMFNGDLVRRATGNDATGFLGQLSGSGLNSSDKIDYLFQAGLGRNSTRDEKAAAGKLFQLHKGNEMYALQDMWWAILNSNEFIFNH